MLRNGEVKHYKGKTITKINGKCYSVGGFFTYFDSYYAAKDAIDAMVEEDRALREIDDYVKNELGGYM